MGYRELLKRYIRFVEAHAGDNYVDAIAYAAEASFSDRDVGELKTLATELYLESGAAGSARGPCFNYRLRLLLICYGLSLKQAAELGGIDVHTVRGWRTNPRSNRYVTMREADFVRFERGLFNWLEGQRNV